ncbi:MAG: MBL fold metallo-hydrolase [Syntrophorhabdales bacterium]|jgi:glyoxylase-like metal-dependent hydrolase (beta-lactamase superfamily II)
MKRITENVYVGANICNHGFVKTKEGVILIDTPAAPSAALAWGKEVGVHGPLRYLINTEPHIDHFGGNYFFDAPVIAHEGARQAMESVPLEYFMQLLGSAAPGEALPEGFFFRLPEITFSQTLSLYAGDHTFRLLHMSGHTPFQSPVYVPEERVLFAGDDVVNGMPFFHESVPEEWLHSLDALEEFDIDVVVPGHGEIGDKSLIKKMKNEVTTCINLVKEAVAKGMTLEGTLATVSFLDRYPQPGADEERRRFFERKSITRLYEVLKG